MHKNVDLKSLLQVLKKRFVMIALISVIAMLAGVLFAKLVITPTYVSSVKIYVNNKVGDTDKMTQGDITSSQELISTYMVFMDDNEVFQKVAEGMNGKYSARKVKEMLSFEQVGDSTFIKITAESYSPEDAQKLCSLTAENAKKTIESTTKLQNIEIYGTANTPDRPASPSIFMYALLGFLVGFLISYVVFYIKNAGDNTIKGKNTIVELFDIPFFGEVPSFDEPDKGARSYGAYGHRNKYEYQG